MGAVGRAQDPDVRIRRDHAYMGLAQAHPVSRRRRRASGAEPTTSLPESGRDRTQEYQQSWPRTWLAGPLTSEHGTYKTVKARFRPWRSSKRFEVSPVRSRADVAKLFNAFHGQISRQKQTKLLGHLSGGVLGEVCWQGGRDERVAFEHAVHQRPVHLTGANDRIITLYM